MTFPGHSPHLCRWKRLDKSKTSAEKVSLRLQVQRASEFAVSEVFSRKKSYSGSSSLAVPLQSSDQLSNHNDAYSEAQALLDDWLSTKLRLELEMEEEDDLMCSAKRSSPAALASSQSTVLNYDNFDDLYKCLAEEEEHSAVNSFLQDLMEQEVLESGMMEELVLDVGQTRKKFRDPIVTMEARHQQVRENRARQEAERQRQQRERKAQLAAREEAKRREQDEEMMKKREARRQEELMQQEMVRLRRQMEERRFLGQLVRHRYGVHTSCCSPLLKWLQQSLVSEITLSYLTRHFSGWYSVVLDQRLRMGKVLALCDWKRQLRAWRAWRAVVWTEQKQREVARTEEELRAENRQCQLAVKSDRRRLLRRCLSEWQLWCRMEREQRELLAQQQETRRKMAALINAASTGKLQARETPPCRPITAPPEACNLPKTTEKVRGSLTPMGAVTQLSQAWQVTRQHVVLTAAELQETLQRGEGGSKSAVSWGGRFENRHAIQQQIITQQRKLLKEQQEQINRLREEQSVTGLKLEMEKTAQLLQLTMKEGPMPKSHTMDARARQRAERRREIEEIKRKKEEEKLVRDWKVLSWAALLEQSDTKIKIVSPPLFVQREEEKQRQLKRHQKLLKLANQHYHRTLLLHRGLAPWKCLLELRQANIKLAESHHNLVLLRRCTLGWQQSARELRSDKEASADQLHQHFLLRRSLSCWKILKDWRIIQEERAERFYRSHTLRRFLLALLDHVTQERLAEWDRLELAQEHNNRYATCDFSIWQLPYLLRKEREREVRRGKLGRKVTEVLPDFCSRLL
uniref:Coiled-coil domain containing 191 n=1 Tax=Monopterus albus TaxID=43700 RepID=A0A3Q3KD43_MONAL